MQSLQKQRGLTFISWLVILVVAGFFIYIAMKITPVYIDNYAVKSILATIKNDPLAARKTKRELLNMVVKRLDVNSIRHIHRDQIMIKRSGHNTTIQIAYEERRPIMYNLSLVMTFDETIELSAN